MSNFKRAREEKGISQKELAAKLKVSQPTVSSWESGKRKPSAEHLSQLCILLDVSADTLLGLPPQSGGAAPDSLEAALDREGIKNPEHRKLLRNLVELMKLDNTEFSGEFLERGFATRPKT